MAAEAAGISFAGGALAAVLLGSARNKVANVAKSLFPESNKEDHPTIQGLRQVFCGDVVTRNSTEYEKEAAKLLPLVHLVVQQRWPYIIFRPHGTADVRRAIRFCRDFEKENPQMPKTIFQYGWAFVPLLRGDTIAQTGADKHKEDACVVDMRELRSVMIDPETRTCWVESGATVKDLDLAAEAYGLCSASGPSSRMSVHHIVTSADAFGIQTNRIGLLMDSLMEAEVVLASGEVKRCSPTENKSIFWLMNGGGAIPACVTRLKFQLLDSPPSRTVLRATLPFPVRLAEKVLRVCDGLQSNEFCYSFAVVSHPYIVGVTVCSAHCVFFCSREKAGQLFKDLIAGVGEGPINGEDPAHVIKEVILPKANWWLDELISADASVTAETFNLPDANLASAIQFLNQAIASKPPFVLITLDHIRGSSFTSPPHDGIWKHRKGFFSGKLLYAFAKQNVESGDVSANLALYRNYCQDLLEHTLDLRLPSLPYGTWHQHAEISNMYGRGVGERVSAIELEYDPDQLFGA